ncbi:MAG: response regulator [Flavobacteriales bacterium]|nr:response regulator [Flavobacteriales bacterium]
MEDLISVTARIGHILLLDDEEDCDFVTRLVLKKAGHQGRVTSFTTATAALDFLRSGHDIPDIMFVDINMPGVNGFEFLSTCEGEKLLPNGVTSVIMFSSSNRPADLERALSFRSVTGFVEKALTVDDFLRVTRDHARAGKE